MNKAKYDIKPSGSRELSYYQGAGIRKLPPDDLVEICKARARYQALEHRYNTLLAVLLGVLLPVVIIAALTR